MDPCLLDPDNPDRFSDQRFWVGGTWEWDHEHRTYKHRGVDGLYYKWEREGSRSTFVPIDDEFTQWVKQTREEAYGQYTGRSSRQ